MSSEQLGTKYKFWFHHQDFRLSLFKEGRPNTGENWAEKIACELAGLLRLPHARYELARCGNRLGVLSPTMVVSPARLVHANELLDFLPANDLPENIGNYRRRDHTLSRIVSYFRRNQDAVRAPYEFQREEVLQTAYDVFLGYLMFDAWIANQDRHSENWGVLRASDGNTFLAPTYDHGSSMGRNESDSNRLAILTTNDRGQSLQAYVNRARSALYAHTSGKALLTKEAFAQGARYAPKAAIAWQARLASISGSEIARVLGLVPQEFMSNIAQEFALQMLLLNQQAILETKLGA